MTLLRSLLRFLCHPLCTHKETLTKTAGKRAYTECLRCEYQSKGVEIAGHDYASTKHSWEPAPIKAMDNAFRPLSPVAIAPEPSAARPVIELGMPFNGTCNGEPAKVAFFSAEAAEAYGLDVTSTECSKPPVLGNLAGHATAVRRKSTLCNKCGEPKEITRPNSNLYRACDAAKAMRNAGMNTQEYPRKKQRKPWNTPRKISAIKPRKTSRKPSSKRSKTA
jgi:hypothetical protein